MGWHNGQEGGRDTPGRMADVLCEQVCAAVTRSKRRERRPASPSTTDYQSVRLDYAYPDVASELNRRLPLVKWFLAIPHYIVLAFLDIALVVVVIIAWFAILFTVHYPRGMFDFVEGAISWHNRVIAYAFVLVTDQYPPFRLSPCGVAGHLKRERATPY
jgi:hypothetical protein